MEIQRKSNRRCKEDTIRHYSNGTMKCACCGENHVEFLVIDHIHGGGNKHRELLKKMVGLGHGGGYKFGRYLRRNGYPKGYRVLCHNCNMTLANFGYCPHQVKK